MCTYIDEGDILRARRGVAGMPSHRKMAEAALTTNHLYFEVAGHYYVRPRPEEFPLPPDYSPVLVPGHVHVRRNKAYPLT